MIEAGLIDAALVGGIDSLCLTTLYGFHSLQLSSPAPCRPFDVARDGISIGEAAAFALLERPPDDLDGDSVLLLGVGESSDAYHMSAPHPEGLGAKRAMQAALHAAALEPGDIDYINLHGTGTPSNDRSESQAVTSIFGPTTPCSSTKGATGHTLGAAGALEAVISALALRNGLMPGGVQTTRIDPTLTAHYIRENRRAPITARAQQFLRFRRHELQFDFWPRRMKVSAYVGGIGVLGPGLTNWPHAAAVLTGRQPYVPAAHGAADSSDAAAAERRRTGRVVKVALGVALEATSQRRCRSRGNSQRIFLLRQRRPYLPRNLPGAGAADARSLADAVFQFGAQRGVGYWSIATGSFAPSNVLCAFDASFGAGLLEAYDSNRG